MVQHYYAITQFTIVPVCFFLLVCISLQSAQLPEAGQLPLDVWQRAVHFIHNGNSATALATTCKLLKHAMSSDDRWAKWLDARVLSWMLGEEYSEKPLYFKPEQFQEENGHKYPIYTDEPLQLICSSIIWNTARTHAAYLLYNPGEDRKQRLNIAYSKIDTTKKGLKIDRKQEIFVMYDANCRYYDSLFLGYRNANQNSFVFLIDTDSQAWIACLQWDQKTKIPVVTMCGQVNFYNFRLRHKAPDDSFLIRALDGNLAANSVTFTFQHGNSVTIDTKSHTITQQNRPFPHVAQNLFSNNFLTNNSDVECIKAMLVKEKNFFTWEQNERIVIKIYLPSLVIQNAKEKTFRALGFINSEYPFCEVTGKLNSSGKNLKIEIFGYHSFPNYLLLHRITPDEIPGFGSVNRSCFIFPLYSRSICDGFGILTQSGIIAFDHNSDAWGCEIGREIWDLSTISLIMKKPHIAQYTMAMKNKNNNVIHNIITTINTKTETITTNESCCYSKKPAHTSHFYAKYPRPYAQNYFEKQTLDFRCQPNKGDSPYADWYKEAYAISTKSQWTPVLQSTAPNKTIANLQMHPIVDLFRAIANTPPLLFHVINSYPRKSYFLLRNVLHKFYVRFVNTNEPTEIPE